MKRTILYLCGLAMLFAGCAKEPELAPAHEETPPRRLSIDITVNPDTRAVKTGWEEGDIVHIYFGVNDVGVGGNAMDHLTMTYSGGEWSYSTLSTKLENALLNQRTGYIYGLYLPVGEPANEYHTFDADKQLWLKLSNGSDTVVGVSYAVSSGTDEYSIDGNDKLTATLELSVPNDFVQFFIPGIEDASNYEFTCNKLKSLVPNTITWNSAGFSLSVWDRNYGLPLKGFIYEKEGQKGLVVCRKISNPGQSADYTFTVRYTNGTSNEGDDYLFTKSFTGKTLNAKDAVKLLRLGSWTRNFTSINGHDFVDMGNGMLWATCNLGAANPKDYGDYFAWAETVPKVDFTYSNYKYMTPGQTSRFYITKYQWDDSAFNSSNHGIWFDENNNFIGDNKLVLDPEDDAAVANWGSPWRMPRVADFTWLLDKCTWTRTTNYNETGVSGMIVTSNIPGFESSTLFLPSAGHFYWEKGYENRNGENGCYWSADMIPSAGTNVGYAGYLTTNSTDDWHFISEQRRCEYGLTVRAVASF